MRDPDATFLMNRKDCLMYTDSQVLIGTAVSEGMAWTGQSESSRPICPSRNDFCFRPVTLELDVHPDRHRAREG